MEKEHQEVETPSAAGAEPSLEKVSEARDAQPAAEAADVGELSELERLRGELEQAKAQAAEYLDGWQRAQAEFANYRKRQEAERAQFVGMANATLLKKLLPVVDDFQRAIETIPPDLEQQPWLQGVLLIKRKLEAVLDSEGVRPIETNGRDFDPLYHEAVSYEEVEGYREGQIIGVVQPGYMLHDRVLRPALVRVAKAPAAQQVEESRTEQNAEQDKG